MKPCFAYYDMFPEICFGNRWPGRSPAMQGDERSRGGSVKGIFRLIGPAAVSGLLLAASFPSIDFYPLAWVALVPLLISLWGKGPRDAFLSGLTTGVVYFFGTLYWIYHSINHYGSLPLALSVFLVFLLCLYLSLYPGLFSLLFASKIRSTRLPALLLAPVFWVALEFLRSYALTGFPWSSIGYSQYRFLAIIQFADITGIYGVSFLVVAVNGAIADFFIARYRADVMPLFPARQVIFGTAFINLLFLSALSYGIWRLGESRPGAPVKVSVVQGNIEQDLKWDPAYQDMVVSTYEELSRRAAAASPDLIVWPETALPFYFNEDKQRSASLSAFQKELNAYLLFGTVLLKKPDTGAYRHLSNSAVLLDRNGTVSYIYDKIYLVPFGEYVPLKGVFFFIEKVVTGVGDYVPGDHLIKAHTVFGSFGTFICYEIIFPGLVRKSFAKDGDFIVTITNDAWFGRTAGPYQHFSMAVFRAVENRKPVIRAANTGISGFIDSNGRILKATGLFEPGVVTMTVKTDSTRSIYSRYGDMFSYLCLAAILILLILL